MTLLDTDNHLMDRSFLTASVPDLVDQLTFDEKRRLLAGNVWWHTVPIPRLNVPSIKVSDGPAGVRGGSSYNMTPTTSCPNGTCLAATFDIDLAKRMGSLLADDALAKKASCVLGPTMNIQRDPRGGRAFESFSEDPTLSGLIAAGYINGLQGKGISATPKHFVCNDQEHDRMGQDSIVQPRAMREVYLRPFQIAQRLADPWAIMTGYNRANGTHISESKSLLTDLLRDEWGFHGIAMSDYGGTYSTAEALNAGLHLEMPGPGAWRSKELMMQTVEAHKVTMSRVDQLVTQLLEWCQLLAQRNPDMVYGKDKKEVARYHHRERDSATVRAINTAGIVLLKNEGDVLPLRSGTVGVIGPNARARVFTGGGSARLLPTWSSTPWQGMVELKPDEIHLKYALGCATHKFLPYLDEHFCASDGKPGFEAFHYPLDAQGEQAKQHVASDRLVRSEMRFGSFARPGLTSDFVTEIRTSFISPITGLYDIEISVTGRFWLYVDEKLVLEMADYKVKGLTFYGNGTPSRTATLAVDKGTAYAIRLVHDTREPPNVEYLMSSPQRYTAIRIGAFPSYNADEAIEEAVALAKSVDVPVVFCGLNEDWESEGDDRPTLALPLRTDELVRRVAQANPRAVVVIQGGSAVTMPWITDVAGVVQAWYGGCETGTSIADILYGHVNPSGRLPLTFPKTELDCSAALSFKSANTKTYYEEGIWVGYKHHVERGIAPLFAFGHGLSYTSFKYSELAITEERQGGIGSWSLTAQVRVTNAGKVAGSHSVHFYTCPPPETPMGYRHPTRSLAAVTKLYDLAPGSSALATVTIDKYAVSHWDELDDVWAVEPGHWRITVCSDAHTPHGEVSFEMGKRLQWTGL